VAHGFVVFDVETPNSKQNRICQIGYVRYSTDSYQPTTESNSLLINPEAPFDEICCGIHGIHPVDILAKPTFAEIWEDGLGALFSDSVLVAHNALFDLSVLSKTLDHYGIAMPDVEYIDTLQLSRSFYPSLPDHRLPTVVNYLGYDLGRHHDAASDAEGAFNIMMETFRRFGQQALCPQLYHSATIGKKAGMDDLIRLVENIADDHRVTFDEAWQLLNWLRCNGSCLPQALNRELSAQLFDVLLDGVVDQDEEQALLASFCKILHPSQTIKQIDYQDRQFGLTGDFLHGLKPEIAEYINSQGGIVKTGVSKKTNYVVIGSYGSDRFGHGTYGTKVEKAIELQGQGVDIKVISEDDLFD